MGAIGDLVGGVTGAVGDVLGGGGGGGGKGAGKGGKGGPLGMISGLPGMGMVGNMVGGLPGMNKIGGKLGMGKGKPPGMPQMPGMPGQGGPQFPGMGFGNAFPGYGQQPNMMPQFNPITGQTFGYQPNYNGQRPMGGKDNRIQSGPYAGMNQAQNVTTFTGSNGMNSAGMFPRSQSTPYNDPRITR